MFYLLALVSMLAYALQGTLMASVYRRIDPLSGTMYRGLSFGISMLPLLLFVPIEEFEGLFNWWPKLFAASFAAVFGNWGANTAYRNLPIGIAQAIINSLIVITIAVTGEVFLGDNLALSELILLVVIIAAATRLSLLRSRNTCEQFPDMRLGVMSAVAGGICLGVAISFFVSVSRQADPFLAAYLWEFLIGILCLVVLCGRSFFRIGEFSVISGRYFIEVLLRSAPTAIGTSCYGLAVGMGSAAVAAAIGTCSAVVMTLLGKFLYDERINRHEWKCIILVVMAVASLQLLGWS